MDNVDVARRFYAAVDAGAYDELRDLLVPSFTHDRPDHRLVGRDAFVRFMREDRPLTDTHHRVEATYTNGDDVAVRGRLLDDDGDPLFAFVDVHRLEDGRLASLTTYVG